MSVHEPKHSTKRVLSPVDIFYAQQSPVTALELAISDHKGYANGNGSTEFVYQLRIALHVMEEIEMLKDALQASLCAVNLQQIKGVQNPWPEGTDGPDGPVYAEIERRIKAALVLLHFR